MNYHIHNVRLLSPGVDLPQASVRVEQGRIAEITPHASGPGLDGQGCWLLPGFIDIHAHGAGGADVTDGTPQALETISHSKLAEGVTTWLPTTLTLPEAQLQHILQVTADFIAKGEAATRLSVPGIHLEGPFINPNAAGAQNPAFTIPPSIAVLERLDVARQIRVLSLASEMPSGLEVVKWACARGITCSLAHTQATYAEFLAAKAAGLTHLTHFCNQMTPLHHREIGVVGAGLLDQEIRLELICDGLHLAPDMLRLLLATKPLTQLMLITDSMAASHLGDGDLDLGGLAVRVRDGAARLASNGALAGSTLKYNDGLRRVANLTSLPLRDLIATTAWNQAQSLSLLDRGKLAPGYRADMVLLNPDFSVVRTWVAGVEQFRAKD
jgi:N-acetylglucosamine-6-phosphate deacetylase